MRSVPAVSLLGGTGQPLLAFPSMGPNACISFPKSGRTWLRVMLDELGFALEYDHAGSAHKHARHFADLDTAAAEAYGRIVLLTRDPRDTVVSGYHQAAVRRSYFAGPMSDFVRDPRHGIEKALHFAELWTKRAAGDPRFHVVAYERLLTNTAAELTRIVAFLGGPVDPPSIQSVAAANTFAMMKAREQDGSLALRYGGRFGGDKVRRGIVGSHRDELSPADVAYCNAALQARSEIVLP